VKIGYKLFAEAFPPQELVAQAVRAEEAGFDFVEISDHYHPWLFSHDHSGFAWSVLGAIAARTGRIELATGVTCPFLRYHPAIVAQAAATTAVLSDGRFTLGVGAGERLNEHVVGRGWPPANVRHEMLTEAVEIISKLFDGGYVSTNGQHYRVDSAKLWDLPESRVPLAVAVSGKQSIETFAPLVDAMVATEPESSLVTAFDDAAGAVLPKIGQQPISWGPDRDAAVQTAHEQFRWFAGGWKVNAELPGTAGFAAATQFVRPDDVAEAIACGPDVAAHVEAVRPFVDAGFTHVALVQIGGRTQAEFVSFAARELLPALREEYGKVDDVAVRPR
jgi:G6PDH family F420-dependent oxidoreductase